MARTSVATDNFNRSNGGLGSNWTDTADEGAAPIIVTNTCRNDSSASDGAAFWSADSFSDDQYALCQLVQMGDSGSTYMGLVVRSDASDLVFGQNSASSTDTVKILWYNGGSYTEIASGSKTRTDDEEWIVEAEGTTFRLIIESSEIISGTNASAPSSGAPGILTNETDDIWDNWEGGDITADTTIKDMIGTGVVPFPR